MVKVFWLVFTFAFALNIIVALHYVLKRFTLSMAFYYHVHRQISWIKLPS